MNSSKILRSAIKKRKSNDFQLIPLIKLQNNKIYIQSEGIQILKKISIGQLIIIAYQLVEHTQIPFQRFQLQRNYYEDNISGIWISQNFIQDQQLGYKFISLICYGSTIEDRLKNHLINCLISSVIIINIKPTTSISLDYIKKCQQKINYSRDKTQNNFLNQHLSNLIILERQSTNYINLENNNSKLNNFKQNLNLFQSFYRSLNYFTLPNDDQLKYSNKALQELDTKFIQIYLEHPHAERKLSYGPILAQFLKQIVNQFNMRKSINYSECLNRIQIDQSYQAYMQGIQYFNECVRQKFAYDKPINNPFYDLQTYKQKAIQRYNEKTKDKEYLMDLNTTITQKQQKILQINDIKWKNQNIKILKEQSGKLLKYAESKDDPNFDVKKQTQRIITYYNMNAGGRTKQQDLNKFLEKLNQTLGEDNYYKNIKISKLERQNKKLQEKIKKLENQGCCSTCQIM